MYRYRQHERRPCRRQPWVDEVYRVMMTFPAGTIDDDVDVCSLFGRMLNPVQVFDQLAVQDILSKDVEPLFAQGVA